MRYKGKRGNESDSEKWGEDSRHVDERRREIVVCDRSEREREREKRKEYRCDNLKPNVYRRAIIVYVGAIKISTGDNKIEKYISKFPLRLEMDFLTFYDAIPIQAL